MISDTRFCIGLS